MATTVAARITKDTAMPPPPTDQASPIGGIETSMAESPPRAVKPMIPTLNRPA